MVKSQTSTKVFDALSDKTRRDIMLRLSDRELTVTEIAEAYHMSMPAVSKHLRILADSGMIINERRGRQRFIRLAPGAMQEAATYLQYYEMSLSSRLAALGDYVSGGLPQEGNAATALDHATHTLTLREAIDAPPKDVWEAYINPDSIRRWWPSNSMLLTACTNDVTTGGIWRFVVRNSLGYDVVFSGVYSDVVPHERLAYTDGVGDPVPGRPEANVTVLFEALATNRTQITKTTVAPLAVLRLNAAWLQIAENNI